MKEQTNEQTATYDTEDMNTARVHTDVRSRQTRSHTAARRDARRRGA